MPSSSFRARSRRGLHALVAHALLLPLLLPLAACTVARMQVEPSLATAVKPLPVTGVNPRIWGRPLAFGPWSTRATKDGTELSWSFQVFGIGAGGSHRPYGFLLQTPGGGELVTACHTRELRLFRGSFEVDLTDAFSPALACAVRPATPGTTKAHDAEDEEWSEGEAALLTLAVEGTRYRGHLHGLGGETLEVRSIHRMEGGRMDSMDPLGYELSLAGRTVAAVETINRGRVWLAPELPADLRDEVAAVVGALLLFGGGS